MVVHQYKLTSYGETKRLLTEGHTFLEPIPFREKLYVFDENGKRIGRFSLGIEWSNESDDSAKALHVHISNRAYINGRLSESTVTGTVTGKLRTLEEIRYECTEVSDSEKHERCMFLLRERTKYYVSVTNTICGVKNQTQKTIPFTAALGLIGESSNAVLLRKMARMGYEGIICLKTILSNGKRYKNYYVTKLSEQMVNGRKMEVLIIYRNITNHNKCNVTMTMALTRAGQLIYLFWSNSKCFLHIDPDVELNSRSFTYGEPPLMKHWHKDIQLHSLYLEEIDHQSILSRSLKYRKEQLRRILGDFLEYLFFMKPDDPICFAIKYFSAFNGSLKECKTRKYSPETISEVYGGEDYGEIQPEYFQFWMEDYEEGFYPE